MLGSYISRTILQWKEISGNDLELYALVRHPEKLPEDVRDQVKVLRQSVAEPIQTDVDFHYIIHAASPASPLIMREDPVGTIAANTLGAYYTLDLARRSHAEGYLFISSREIYGQPYDDQGFMSCTSFSYVLLRLKVYLANTTAAPLAVKAFLLFFFRHRNKQLTFLFRQIRQQTPFLVFCFKPVVYSMFFLHFFLQKQNTVVPDN